MDLVTLVASMVLQSSLVLMSLVTPATLVSMVPPAPHV